jgi:hypothetical protein
VQPTIDYLDRSAVDYLAYSQMVLGGEAAFARAMTWCYDGVNSLERAMYSMARFVRNATSALDVRLTPSITVRISTAQSSSARPKR